LPISHCFRGVAFGLYIFNDDEIAHFTVRRKTRKLVLSTDTTGQVLYNNNHIKRTDLLFSALQLTRAKVKSDK